MTPMLDFLARHAVLLSLSLVALIAALGVWAIGRDAHDAGPTERTSESTGIRVAPPVRREGWEAQRARVERALDEIEQATNRGRR